MVATVLVFKLKAMGCLFDSPGETKTRRLACLILYLNSFNFMVRSSQEILLTKISFLLRCNFLNYFLNGYRKCQLSFSHT